MTRTCRTRSECIAVAFDRLLRVCCEESVRSLRLADSGVI